VVFLIAALVTVSPPSRTLVFAFEAEMFAGFTGWFALLALFPP